MSIAAGSLFQEGYTMTMRKPLFWIADGNGNKEHKEWRSARETQV